MNILAAPYIPFLAIIFGIGALIHTVLIYGAWKRNDYAIFIWCVIQVPVGGFLGWLGIFIVVWKAYQELKKENPEAGRNITWFTK